MFKNRNVKKNEAIFRVTSRVLKVNESPYILNKGTWVILVRHNSMP